MLSQPHPIRVLVVDDDEMSRELLTVLLASEGYMVQTAESGEAALALLDTGSVADLVLTDMQLPGVSGAGLARALRGSCGTSTLLLAISGSEPAAEAVALFDGFLLKPFQMEEVAAALKVHTSSAVGRVAPETGRVKKPRVAPARRQPRTSSVTEIVSTAASPASPIASKKHMSIEMHGDAIAPTGEAIDKGDGANAIPVLNEKIFQQLTVSMSGSQLQEMYTLCVDDARQRIAGMRRLAAAHDDAMFVREAHAIKGGSGMLGATELHRRASELEAHGLAKGLKGETQDVNSLDELSAACDRLERMLGSRL
jgi:DNA-binding response OmpR family regulator/HPt (histidine-containing phosphotransfer) domain-containing protein